ncbi:Magnesium-transporting ATPase, P-type 1 [Listeria fleischmannii 1991]|uniref:Magnesium-transporting ATPase, P-type 1 n=2 Tax=Listeria fleischmannii TaxID=1069827 RepID=A0A2X3HIT9_9LIST|nr:magnesium-translocating P-type ATPase [Listeria fleischmannii]EMG29171.1 Mg2+ transport ATPase, P-type 1 [Listeria fleischmannii subsp. fleischmannii LU2006-1]KMT58877.1 Magnesium-transporting ATPase, P-type 1 [Listeria fleischmannii 1991]SQC72151.1 Magnesium-transporting ATPase, P-type 1 [Listeria fleischmannii subsp. fleischmannii]
MRPNEVGLLKESKEKLDTLFTYYQTNGQGLNENQVKKRLVEFGYNRTKKSKPKPLYLLLAKAFNDPFIYILIVLAVISFLTSDFEAAIIMSMMILFSALISFIQSVRAQKASFSLQSFIQNKTTVIRNNKKQEIDTKYLVQGDILHLSTGAMVPADVRIFEAQDLFINQSMLTGESLPVEKYDFPDEKSDTILGSHNLSFMGTDVVSGTGRAIVLRTGDHTIFGELAEIATQTRGDTSFDKGVRSISKLLFYLMLVMVPIVFAINGFLKGDWLQAFMFSVAVAVGLTPEMLPMIVNTNLAKGAIKMAKKKVIVKELSAIQNLGAMDILCTDKTGTLTCDKISLVKHVTTTGKQSMEVLELAFLNSYYQTGYKNVLDYAVIKHTEKKSGQLRNLKRMQKLDEIPFDFERRLLSVVIRERSADRLITKGAVLEVFQICTHFDADGQIKELTEEDKIKFQAFSEELNKAGMRVIAICYKDKPKASTFSKNDEESMILKGFIGFLDPVKSSAKYAIESLTQKGVHIKVLTGDNEIVTKKICEDVGIPNERFLLGSQIEKMTDCELHEALVKVSILAKLSPLQKARIVAVLKRNNHTVGFMGDGMNDAPALRKADVGISVDTATDITKDASSIILLEKSLTILEQGLAEGRTVFGNILKYMKMTASSNFGNVFSVLVASAFLPFLPMLSIHLLLQNLLYDVSQLTLPWDRMDDSFLKKPRKWNTKNMLRFIVTIGPVSSVFDILTFLVMWFVFKANTVGEQALFQSGWFVVGLLTQTLVVHMIRTEKIPFIESVATKPVMLSTCCVMGLGLVIPFTGFGHAIGLVDLPALYFGFLVCILISYMVTIQIVKHIYIKKFQDWI